MIGLWHCARRSFGEFACHTSACSQARCCKSSLGPSNLAYQEESFVRGNLGVCGAALGVSTQETQEVGRFRSRGDGFTVPALKHASDAKTSTVIGLAVRPTDHTSKHLHGLAWNNIEI